MAFLELKNVSKSYGTGDSRTDVLRGINLSVKEGEFIAIVGFSGSGKTTIGRLLLRLWETTRGSVSIAGIDVRGRYEEAFTLDQADQTFLSAMAMVFAYPVPHENYEHHIAQGDPGAVERNPVGTGPFVFEAWERGVQLTFTRNKRYWERNRPNPDRMVLIEQLSGETAVGRFSNGDLDVLTSLPAVLELARRFPRVWVAAGVHPHQAAEEAGSCDPAPFIASAADPRVVAIGECGLDYFYDKSPREVQRASFAAQLEAAS